MEKLSRHKVLVNPAAAGAGAAIAGAAKAQGTEDPNLSAQKERMEVGFAKCIFPKRNRIVFMHNEAYHMVTRVNEAAGDNARMSLAGFFLEKNPITGRAKSGEDGGVQ